MFFTVIELSLSPNRIFHIEIDEKEGENFFSFGRSNAGTLDKSFPLWSDGDSQIRLIEIC